MDLAEGEARAQAFHDGMEAGMKAGADLMKDAVVQHFEKLSEQSALYRGMFHALRDEVQAIDPFKLYDPKH